MPRFRKKPVVIDAIQFTGKNGQEIMSFMLGTGGRIVDWGSEKMNIIEIETLEGVMIADKKDWIIKGVKGEFYPCKPDIFEMTYEAVDSDQESGK